MMPTTVRTLRLLALPLLVAVPLLAVAAPVPESVTHAKLFKRAFGTSHSPANAGSFNFDGATLTAELSDEWISSQDDPLGSLHTERTVRGDFELTVTMRTTAPTTPPKTTGAKRCDLGGGLAVWEPDAKNPEKVAVDDIEEDKVVSVCRYYTELGDEEWVRGEDVEYPGHCYDRHHDREDPAQTVHLRITRRGDVLATAMSADGEKWTELRSRPVALPDAVSVGVWAYNATGVRCDVVFEEFTITPSGKK